MELDFKPERLRIILRLRNLSQSEVGERMSKILKLTYPFKIDKWFSERSSPADKHKVQALEEACIVPKGFFHYNTVDISMDKDLMITIFIPDTKQEVKFQL